MVRVGDAWQRLHDGQAQTLRDERTRRLDPLKLVTGNEDPVAAVLKGRLSVRGALALAARLPKIFAVAPH